MKKLTTIIFSILTILTIPVMGQVEYTQYTKAEIEQDLTFAFETLISIHPLFLDNDQLIHFQNQFSKIEKSIKDNMTQNEVFLLLAPLFASLNDGHTGIIVPTDQRIEFTKAGGKSFPFFVNIVDDSIYVSFYCGNDTTLFQKDDQLLKINGIKATKIIHDMESLFSGKAPKIRQKAIADKFRFLIWMLYGFNEDYNLTIKNNDNDIIEMTIPGISSTEFKQNIKRMPKTNLCDFALDIDLNKSTAVMKIKSFRDLDGFCLFADSAFANLKTNKIKNLVLDIRDNFGGRSVVVDSLMNYLTDKPYMQYKKIEVRISPELKEHYKKRYPHRLDWINKYSIDDNVVIDHNIRETRNKNNRFDGNLFLLTNSSSFSAAATFAGVFKKLKLGTIIGEETGGTIAYYGDFWFLNTPNSNIKFYVSPKRFIQYGGEEYNRGVIPDHIVHDKKSSIVEFANDIIEQKQGNAKILYK